MKLSGSRVIILQDTKKGTSALKAAWSTSPCSLLAQHLGLGEGAGAGVGPRLTEHCAWGLIVKPEPLLHCWENTTSPLWSQPTAVPGRALPENRPLEQRQRLMEHSKELSYACGGNRARQTLWGRSRLN